MDEKSLLRGSGRMRRCRWFMKVLFNIFAPWLLFWGVYAATVGWLHKYWPIVTWAIVVLAWIFVVVTTLAYRKAARKGRAYDAIWGLFLTLSLALSIIAGTMIGNREFSTYWHRFYDFQALESYVNINPMDDKGKPYMDGGQYYFKEGSHIDKTRVIAFKNFDIYCIAPIVRQALESEEGGGVEGLPRKKPGDKPPLVVGASGTIDWFAVGVNCCKPDGEDWTCSVGNARNGLRVLDEDHRPFYNMASIMWKTKFDLPSDNPIFVEFLLDPLGKIGGLNVQGGLAYWNNVYAFLGLDVMIVLLFVIFLESQK
jgi:hypothetical protein